MPPDRPGSACRDVSFAAPLPIGEAGEVALEDYARAVTGASTAHALAAAGDRVRGVHLCGLAGPTPPERLRDIEDFARDMAGRGGGSGLGWS
jgi:hypothetical protein